MVEKLVIVLALTSNHVVFKMVHFTKKRKSGTVLTDPLFLSKHFVERDNNTIFAT